MSTTETLGSVGPYEFFAQHGWGPGAGVTVYGFKIDGDGGSELFHSLDHAIASAVGERHTGPRGAGGTAVGTAADWFMRMIGAPLE
jgi:hypothetical protein